MACNKEMTAFMRKYDTPPQHTDLFRQHRDLLGNLGVQRGRQHVRNGLALQLQINHCELFEKELEANTRTA